MLRDDDQLLISTEDRAAPAQSRMPIKAARMNKKKKRIIIIIIIREGSRAQMTSEMITREKE